MNSWRSKMTRWQCGFALLVLASLSACLAPPPRLEAPLAEAEKSSAVVVFLPQTEIGLDQVSFDGSTQSLAVDLVGGIVAGKMASNRAKAIIPYRQVLLSHNLENQLIDALREHLPLAMVQADASFKIVRNEAEWRYHLHSVVPANVLLIRARYAFEQNLEVAYVYADVDFSRYHRVPLDSEASRRLGMEATRAAKPLLLHRGSYYSQHVLQPLFDETVEGLSGFNANAEAWSRDWAEPARRAFASGMREVAELIALDSQGYLPNPTDPEELWIKAADARLGLVALWADVLMRSDDRILVKHSQSHQRYWIDPRQVKSAR